jgi:hypothetical protein
MVILSVWFENTDHIVHRWTGSSVTWTPPLIKCQPVRTKERTVRECEVSTARHVDLFELVICQSWEKYASRFNVTRRPYLNLWIHTKNDYFRWLEGMTMTMHPSTDRALV